MEKRQIARMIANKNGIKFEKSLAVIDDFIEAINKYAQEDGRIEIRGLGVFSMRKQNARMVYATLAGRHVPVPARIVMVFKQTRKGKDGKGNADSGTHVLAEQTV